MKRTIILCFILFIYMTSCMTIKENPIGHEYNAPDDGITQSLFTDKSATISEENLQMILDGYAFLPENLRVAVINLDNTPSLNRRYMWSDEDYISSRQKYISTITNNLKEQPRVKSVMLIPDMMLPASPSFTTIREAAVRMQADIAIVYSVRGGLYSKYKVFSPDKYKAFATTQVMILDVRTGLVPFTKVVTEEYQSQKGKTDFDDSEARIRIRETAVSFTLKEVCEEINAFLNKKEGE